MKNTMVTFIFSAFDRKYPFLWILFQKSKLFVLAGCWFSFFFFFLDRKYPFCVNLVQKFKIFSLSWKLVPRLFRISKIQWWCPLYYFRPFLQVLSKKALGILMLLDVTWSSSSPLSGTWSHWLSLVQLKAERSRSQQLLCQKLAPHFAFTGYQP